MCGFSCQNGDFSTIKLQYSNCLIAGTPYMVDLPFYTTDQLKVCCTLPIFEFITVETGKGTFTVLLKVKLCVLP